MKRSRWLWCLPAVTAVALAGCSSTSKSASATTTSPTTALTAPPASDGTTSTTAPSTGPGTTRVSAPPICATSQLSATLTNPSGTAGSVDFQLELTNESSTTCVLQGFPGVSFVAGTDGHQVGAAALRPANLAPGDPVVVAPGASGYAPLAIADAANFPASSCQSTSVLGLRVYPPGQRTALYIPHPDQACANTQTPTLSVDPFFSRPTG